MTEKACSPVLLLIFNRLECALEVLSAVRTARPTKFYVAGDGARDLEESDVVERVRNEVLAGVDWECEVRTFFREDNLGCRRSVSEAVTWFFDQEESGIVLEDDCLPHPRFFAYCTEMLDRYSCSQEMVTIAGSRFLCYDVPENFGHNLEGSVFHCWGWATWADRWHLYRKETPSLDKVFERCSTSLERRFWERVYRICVDDRSESWAYRIALACFVRGGIHLLPPVNLVVNRGFKKGTHSGKRPWIVPDSFVDDDEIEAVLKADPAKAAHSEDRYYRTQFRSLLVRVVQRVIYRFKERVSGR